VGVAFDVEPAAVVETGVSTTSVVGFPVAYRVAHPCGFGSGGRSRPSVKMVRWTLLVVLDIRR